MKTDDLIKRIKPLVETFESLQDKGLLVEEAQEIATEIDATRVSLFRVVNKDRILVVLAYGQDELMLKIDTILEQFPQIQVAIEVILSMDIQVKRNGVVVDFFEQECSDTFFVPSGFRAEHMKAIIDAWIEGVRDGAYQTALTLIDNSFEIETEENDE